MGELRWGKRESYIGGGGGGGGETNILHTKIKIMHA